MVIAVSIKLVQRIAAILITGSMSY